MSDTAGTGQELHVRAGEHGVADALVFRRLSAHSWAHVGGFGRGRGWAGIVSVTDAEAADRIPSVGAVRRFDHGEAACVLGPYYARCGAIIRTGADVAVVFGGSDPVRLAAASDAQLCAVAADLDVAIEDVAPSKRLADELEVLHAVREVLAAPTTTLRATLQHMTEVAVRALSCDVGYLRTRRRLVVTVGDQRGQEPGFDRRVAGALDQLADLAASRLLCVQDVHRSADLSFVELRPDLRSLLVVPIPAPLGGVLVAGHTAAGPRGFTELCQRLGEQVVEAGSVLAQTAAAREELHSLAERQHQAARTDPLTGLGNRLRWQEQLAEAQRQADAGEPFTVITVDLDGLKTVNDTDGHAAGDVLLRRCAEVLRLHCRDSDLAVRLGGDEFALLLPMDETLAAARVSALIAALSGTDGDIRASVGAATAHPGQRLADAVHAADKLMYAHKQQRREPVGRVDARFVAA
jgi:diguanylate cyclase (GGDEF)-like protein